MLYLNEPRICENYDCNVEFRPRKPMQTFCSKKCSREWQSAYRWSTSERNRLISRLKKKTGKFPYRTITDIEPPLDIERRWMRYAHEGGSMNFEDWYDAELTYGGINW